MMKISKRCDFLNYETLLKEADSESLIVKEKPLRTHGGRIKGNRIAIKMDMTATEKACVLAKELGHHLTSTGNILDLSDIRNQKQELHARLWGYNKMIGLMGIVRAYKHRCRNLYEMAEYLEVSEWYLKEALEQYQQKYGSSITVDNYIIIFEPHLAVIERISSGI